MLGMKQLRQRSGDEPETRAAFLPLLDFGRLHEVSAASTPIMFGHIAVPTEIFYTIIDHFRNEKGVLAKCALVSKSWYYATRPHIFRDVHIREYGNTYLFYPFSRTLRLAADIRPLIRELHLELHIHAANGAKVQLRDRPEYNLEALASVIEKLSHLESLTFTDTYWQLEEDATVPQLSHGGVKQLTFSHHIGFEHDARLYDIVRWFPNLKELNAEKASMRTEVSRLAEPLSPALKIEHLDLAIEPMTPDFLLDCIAATETANTLKSFSYQVWQNSPSVLSPFFERVGHSMTDLTLYVHDERLLEEMYRNTNHHIFNIKSCTALETLSLEFVLFASRIWGNHLKAVSACIEGLLSRLLAPNLHTLTLCLDIPSAQTEFTDLNLHRVISALKNLPELKRIVIMASSSSVQVAKTQISAALGPFTNMLEFTTFPNDINGRISEANRVRQHHGNAWAAHIANIEEEEDDDDDQPDQPNEEAHGGGPPGGLPNQMHHLQVHLHLAQFLGHGGDALGENEHADVDGLGEEDFDDAEIQLGPMLAPDI